MRTCAFSAAFMDIELFLDMLKIDSTTGKEGEFAKWIAARFSAPGRHVETFEVDSDGALNVLVTWGKAPKVIFCSHLDTVPPYISPELTDEGIVKGRGSCDAKGQIFSMYEACKVLESRGYDDFGLLLLSGEETGSYGAKAFNSVMSGDSCVMSGEVETSFPHDTWVIVGEPTDNMMAVAAKGTKSFELVFEGEAFHSGYPEHGRSAVLMFNDFLNALRSIGFPHDGLLGETTWNIGKLVSDNPQNILSGRLSCRLYFRTTFESDEMVCNIMKNIAGPEARLRFGKPTVQDGSDIASKEVAIWQKYMSVKPFGGDSPTKFETLEGFPSKAVSFGSDAPQLTCFGHRILCGPGSILVAHRDDEHIRLDDIATAMENYVKIYETIRQK